MGSKETYNVSVFLDLKKTLDTLDHSILLNKTEAHGVRGIENKKFESYLANRNQYVEFIGQASDWANITTRAPQGSLLGLLLILVYINDIDTTVQFSEVYRFADDTWLQVFVRLLQVFKIISPIFVTGSFPISCL